MRRKFRDSYLMFQIAEKSYSQVVTEALNTVRADKIKVAALKHAEKLNLPAYEIQYTAYCSSYLSGLIINARNKDEALLYIKLYSLIIQFEEKQKQFAMRGEQKAYDACDRLITTMVDNIKDHFEQEKPLENREVHFHAFHEAFTQVVDDVKDELESHRGVHRILDGIATILASLVVFYPMTYLYQKLNRINYTFFKTDSRCWLDKLENVMGEVNAIN